MFLTHLYFTHGATLQVSLNSQLWSHPNVYPSLLRLQTRNYIWLPVYKCLFGSHELMSWFSALKSLSCDSKEKKSYVSLPQPKQTMVSRQLQVSSVDPEGCKAVHIGQGRREQRTNEEEGCSDFTRWSLNAAASMSSGQVDLLFLWNPPRVSVGLIVLIAKWFADIETCVPFIVSQLLRNSSLLQTVGKGGRMPGAASQLGLMRKWQ